MHFKLLPAKTNDKVFKKSKETTYFGEILGTFGQESGQKCIFLEKKSFLTQLLNIPIIFCCTKNPKKLVAHSWEKCQNDWRAATDRQCSFFRTLRTVQLKSVHASLYQQHSTYKIMVLLALHLVPFYNHKCLITPLKWDHP